MKSILAIIALALIYACGQTKEKTGNDTTAAQDNKTSGRPSNYTDKEILNKDIAGYSVIIKRRDELPDSNGYYSGETSGNFLFVRHLQTNKTDSLKLENYDDMLGVVIEELSDSLGFKKPALLLSWTGDSDVPWHELVVYRNDSLRTIFLYDAITSLKRKDEWTLEGFSISRDEIASSFQRDYPFTISLRTGDIKNPLPAVQYIGWPTVALDNIKAYKMTGARDSSAHNIDKGTMLTIDTLYRWKNTVRLRIGDSLILYTTPEALKEKIETNTAG